MDGFVRIASIDNEGVVPTCPYDCVSLSLAHTSTAASTSLAVMVCRLDSRAKSLAHAVKYTTKIPQALANAADASFPTLVDPGRLVLMILRTHANAGSNSIGAVAGFPLLLLLLLLFALSGVAGAMVKNRISQSVSDLV